MRFVTAVALAAVMLWVPVDGVAQEISLYDSEGEAVAYIDLSSTSPPPAGYSVVFGGI